MLKEQSIYRSPAYWILGLLLLLLIPPMLNAPFGRDQGIFAWVASVMLDGGMPYRDAWDIKGPLVYCVYAIMLFFSSHQVWIVYVPDVLLITAALISLAKLATRYPHISSQYGAGIIMLLAGGTSYLNAGQPDTWAAYAIVIIICDLICLKPDNLNKVAGRMGLWLGCFALIKPQYAVLVPVVMAALWHTGICRSQLLKAWVVCGSTWLAVVVAMAIWLFHAGAWMAFIEAVQFVGSIHASAVDLLVILPRILLSTEFYWLLLKLYLLAAIFGLVLLKRVDARAAYISAGFMLATFIIYISQGKLFTYHTMPLLMSCTLPLACLALRLLDCISDKASRVLFAALLFSLGVGCYFTGSAVNYSRWQHCFINYNQSSCQSLYAVEDYTAYKLEEVAAYIRAHSQPQDKIYLWGADAGLYLAAQRKSASRFGYSYPLLEGGSGLVQQNRQQLVAELIASSPVFIVVGLKDASPITDPQAYRAIQGYEARDSIEALPGFPQLEQFIANNYRPAFANTYMQVYSLK